MIRTVLSLSIIFSSASLASIAHAQSVPGEAPNETTTRGGIAYVGALASYGSEYLGSADEEFRTLPYVSLNNVKGFDLFGTALTYRLIETGTGEGLGKWSLRAGPRVGFQGGRDSEDSPTLDGFEDVDGSLLLGGYLRGTLGPLGYRLDAGQDVISGHEGFTVDASVGTFYRHGNFAVQPAFTVSWADNNHNESFFGVTTAQSAASGLTPYAADSGIYSYSASLVSWVEINDYAVSFIGSYRWFTDRASDSPILQAPDGSDQGFFAGLGLSRKFDLSKF